MPHQIASERHQTVVSVLREAAQRNGDVEAYVEPDQPGVRARRSLTFGQWDRAADGMAGALAGLGVGRGDVVCLLLPSCNDYAVLYAALLRLGAITSGVNPRMGRGEVGSIIERTAPVLLVLEPESSDLVPDGVTQVVERAEVMAAQHGDAPRTWPELSAHDPVAVVWTSGTTGAPKGALFDHANLAAVARGTDVLSRPGDRRLSPVPFAHVGYMTRAWDEIAHGVTTVITPTPWRAEDAIRIIGEERITVGQGVPTQWSLMLARPELARTDVSSLRVAGTGAARVPSTLVAAMRERLGVPVVVRYTSTESSLGTGTTLSSSEEEVATTVGAPVPGVEIRIADNEGRPVAVGAVGRVLLRSDAAMRGYWGRGPGRGRSVEELIDAEATAAVLSDDGWVTMGDFGALDQRGNLRLAGRAHERYIRGGYNVYPAEVEEVLATHPAVERVAVVGAPDPVLGEIGVAIVVAATGADLHLAALRAQCAGKLSDYKAPDVLVLVNEIPQTPMMKVDTRQLAVLAERAAAEHRAARSGQRR
jgi:acyl-CoA synthetase (AMP-forming)/AMP-acid ligase II